MSIDKDKIITQEDVGEAAPIDEVEGRVEAEMKLIEGRAKDRKSDLILRVVFIPGVKRLAPRFLSIPHRACLTMRGKR